jgi:hypothetical protein
LDAIVEQAQQTINGVEPQTLRASNGLRQMVARDFEQIQASVGELLIDSKLLISVGTTWELATASGSSAISPPRRPPLPSLPVL